MSDRADFVRVKRSFVLTGTGNLIELARFSCSEFDLSGFFITLTGANSRETENVRDIEEFQLNGSRDSTVYAESEQCDLGPIYTTTNTQRIRIYPGKLKFILVKI